MWKVGPLDLQLERYGLCQDVASVARDDDIGQRLLAAAQTGNDGVRARALAGAYIGALRASIGAAELPGRGRLSIRTVG